MDQLKLKGRTPHHYLLGEHVVSEAERRHGRLDWFGVTLTLKGAIPRDDGSFARLNEETARKVAHNYLRTVNRETYGRGHRRRDQHLSSAGGVERGPLGGNLHIHLIIEKPAGQTEGQFKDRLATIAKRFRWINNRNEFVPVTGERGAQKWATYTLKSPESWDDQLMKVRKKKNNANLMAAVGT